MQRTLGIGILALAAASVAQAQYTEANGGYAPAVSQVAPVLRPDQAYQGSAQQIFDLQPNPGVSVRSDVSNGVETMNASGAVTELRVVQGRADVAVHHPADHSEILVDLPGGQVSLLKDGLYTFNASTNTVRVLHGEAEAFDGTKSPEAKGTKVKETQQVSFFGNAKLKAVNAYPYELSADLLGGDRTHGDGAYSGSAYGEGFYDGYPAYAYGNPWGFYPYGYGFGYPVGLGVGFGYYGGFHGGYRGGFRR